jgi:Transposase IS116/IS110/IS902 family
MSVPGIGPIISSAMVAAIGTGHAFTKGRDFAAWLGLVPKQTSTGARTILGKISKRGNRYLRVLFVQAAWAVLIKPRSWDRHGLKPWLEAGEHCAKAAFLLSFSQGVFRIGQNIDDMKPLAPFPLRRLVRVARFGFCSGPWFASTASLTASRSAFSSAAFSRMA